jgi:hypothetical protein
LSRNESGRFGTLKSDSTHHFFRNACTKSGSLRFSVFRLLTDFVCLYTYEFWLSLCKIVRSSVILLLPLFVLVDEWNSYTIVDRQKKLIKTATNFWVQEWKVDLFIDNLSESDVIKIQIKICFVNRWTFSINFVFCCKGRGTTYFKDLSGEQIKI